MIGSSLPHTNVTNATATSHGLGHGLGRMQAGAARSGAVLSGHLSGPRGGAQTGPLKARSESRNAFGLRYLNPRLFEQPLPAPQQP